MNQHPWALVGPWYRSQSVGGPPANRTTAPIIQKYGDSKFMDKFVKDPQHSLRFLCEDMVDRYSSDPNALITPDIQAQLDDGLKLFLHAHQRFYLVVCELHCVIPGFPSTKGEHVCESGFVIRRKTPLIEPEVSKALATRQQTVKLLKQKVLKLKEQMARRNKQDSGMVSKASKQVFGDTLNQLIQKQLDSNTEKLKQSEAQLQDFIQVNNIKAALQGWVVDGDDEQLGEWNEVEATPQTIVEKVYPLYPLVPLPDDHQHSAAGKSMWFGLIPTATADLDKQGDPHIDDSDLYHIRCFVRRKKDCCTNNGPNCCHGEVIWSEATENFRVAAFFDLDGTSHKPVNIKLPDLDALRQQADLGPPGRGAGAKTIAPANSSLNFGTNGMDMPSGNPDSPTRPGTQICFFAILLFFIVALFLFRLFLPIILFLFQLWFLLKLKLCIPPSVSLDVGLAADLEIHGPDIEAAIALDAGLVAEIGGGFASEGDLMSAMTQGIGEQLSSPAYLGAPPPGVPNDFSTELKGELDGNLSLNEVADIYLAMSRDFSNEPDPQAPTGQVPVPEDGIIYFDPVEA